MILKQHILQKHIYIYEAVGSILVIPSPQLSQSRTVIDKTLQLVQAIGQWVLCTTKYGDWQDLRVGAGYQSMSIMHNQVQ